MIENIRIFEPQNFQSGLAQLFRALRIIADLFRMRVSVKFDDEFGLRAIKINDVL
jgi:hypothetical protein